MSVTEVQDTAQDAPEPTPKPTAPKVPAESLSGLCTALIATALLKMEELKAVSEKQAKVGDVGKLLSEALQASDNPEVKARREKIAKAHEAILRMTKEAEDLVKPTLKIPTEAELAAMEVTYKTLSSELNSFNTVFTAEVAKDHAGVTLFDYTGEIPGKRKGAKAGQGQGTARPRVSSVEYTKDVKGEGAAGWVKAEKDGKSTFSHLALALKKETGQTVSASDFHSAWTEQNGVTEWTDLNEVSTFSYTVYDEKEKGHVFLVRVTR